MRKIYERLELNSFLKNEDFQENSDSRNDESKENKRQITKKFNVVTNKNIFEKILKNIEKNKFISFDLETTSLDYMEAEIVGISLALNVKESFYIPLLHEDNSKYKQLNIDYVLNKFKPLLESKKINKLGHNLKYDRNVLLNYNIVLNAIAHDSMLLSYVHDPTAIRHGLDNAAEKYLSYSTIHYEDVAGKGAKQIPFSQVDIEVAAKYACEDSIVSYELYNYLWEKVSKNKSIVNIYTDIEMP